MCLVDAVGLQKGDDEVHVEASATGGQDGASLVVTVGHVVESQQYGCVATLATEAVETSPKQHSGRSQGRNS